MRLKELEGILQQVETFQSPKVQLEQYATSAQLASHIVYTAENSFGDVSGKLVGDLGCGSGVFAIGARCLEAGYCVGFDIDEDALALARQNLSDFDMDRVDLVRCDVTVDTAEVDDDVSDSEDDVSDSEDEASGGGQNSSTSSAHATESEEIGVGQAESPPPTSSSLEAPGQWCRWRKQFDTVFLNPPFGTKANAGIDVAFLKRAVQLSRGAVYSLHKTATRKHLMQLAETQLCVRCEVVAELRFDLPKTYKFHRKKSVDVAVDLLRFDCSAR